MNQKILHNKLAYLKKLDLFKNIKSFESFEALEQGIASLNENDLEPHTKKRLKSICIKRGEEAYRKALQGALNNLTGAIGEVIAAGYLNLNGDKDIYPSERISNKIKRNYKMATGKRDAGVDICSVDAQSKKHKAVQVKWFSEGENKIVPISKLATAFSDSENFPHRTIITNAKDISKSLKNKNRLTVVNRIRLKNYFTKTNLKKLYKLIKRSKNPIPPKFDPLPHQAKAIEDCLKGFKGNSRGQLIMACGTGKTLTSMWVAKAVGAKKIVIFVPSISLAGQLMKEWWYHGQFSDDFPFITVCSDPSVAHELDGMEYQLAELDYPVTTDAKELKKALKSSKQHVVICTYHSASILKEAGLEFDFGYFDEAHRTTGNHGDSFSFALSDRNIKISKRLFGTATPKFINGETTSRVNSMENEAVYGPVFHHLGFSQAVEQKLIVPVKIITCHISSQELSRELVKMGITEVNNVGNVRTSWLANLFAFKKALEKFNLKKTFAYTSTIKAAKELAFNDSLGIESFIPNTESFHVNGQMPSNDRSNEVDHFSNSTRAVMTNVRCLVEGVDLPAVDCVAFFQPRKSVVDIVQAVGRAMRKSGNKKCGYIFVPLYVEKGKSESLEEAMAEQTSYKILVDVITAMAEHNDALREKLTTIQRIQGIDEDDPEEPVEKILQDEFEVIGAEEVDINLLKDSISVELLRLFNNSRKAAWDRFVIAAEMLYKKYGHCNTAHRHLKDGGEASRIDDSLINSRYREAIRKARRDYKNNNLSSEEVKLLENFNIDWKSDKEYEFEVWENKKDIWKKEKASGKRISKAAESWATQQLNALKDGKIKKSDHKWKLLEEVGFFDPHFNTGGFLTNKKHQNEILKYVDKYGHARKNTLTMTASQETTCNTIIAKYFKTQAQKECPEVDFGNPAGSLLSEEDIKFYESLPFWSWEPEKQLFREKLELLKKWIDSNPGQKCVDGIKIDNPFPFSLSRGKTGDSKKFALGKFQSYHVRKLRSNELKDWQVELIVEVFGNTENFLKLVLTREEAGKKCNNFTPEEDKIIKENCSKMSDKKLSETLLKRHSHGAVCGRRRKLGIRKARNGHTGSEGNGNPIIS